MEVFLAYFGASKAIKMFWLYFWDALGLFIFIYRVCGCFQIRNTLEIFTGKSSPKCVQWENMFSRFVCQLSTISFFPQRLKILCSPAEDLQTATLKRKASNKEAFQTFTDLYTLRTTGSPDTRDRGRR